MLKELGTSGGVALIPAEHLEKRCQLTDADHCGLSWSRFLTSGTSAGAVLP